MSALRKHQADLLPVEDTEVIYLLVPPAPAPTWEPAPYTLAERLALASMAIQAKFRPAGETGLATYAAILGVGILGYSVYTIKSFLGFDIFPVEHIENFAPVPGFGRL